MRLPTPRSLFDWPDLRSETLSAANKAFPLATLGAALYRAGRFQEAIRSLEGGQVWLEARAFLAMSHARMGHRNEARRWLDRIPDGPAGQAPAMEDDLRRVAWDLSTYFWELRLRLLRREAEALILFDPIFPDDPFAR